MGYGHFGGGIPIQINTVKQEQLNQLETIEETNPITVRDFGATGAGQINEAQGIKGAIAYAATVRKKTVHVPDGIYNINEKVVVDRGIHLKLDAKAVFKLKADIDCVEIMPDAKFSGGMIDAQDVDPFNHACILLDGNNIFSLLNDQVACHNTVLRGPDHEGTDQNFSGTGIRLYSGIGSGGNPSYVSFTAFNTIGIFNFENGILLDVDESITTDDQMAWVNGNNFDNIIMMNCVKPITLNGDSNIPRDCTGNLFSNMQVQINSYCEWAVNIIGGGWNRLEGSFWDLHNLANDKPGFRFGQKTRFNKISGMHGYESRHIENLGYLNMVSSVTNHTPDNQTMYYPISTPYQPNALGNQDDVLANAIERGYTMTQTSAHPLPESQESYEFGDFAGLFRDRTNYGCIWYDLVADYDNPVVLELDLTNDPIEASGFVGMICPEDGSIVQNCVFEVHDGTGWQESDWYTYNTQNRQLVTPPWFVNDFIEKIRVKFWNNDDTPRDVFVGRLFASSTVQGGQMYLPKQGGKVYGDIEFNGEDNSFIMVSSSQEKIRFAVDPNGALYSKKNPYPGYTPDQMLLAQRLSRPYKPNFNGLQDDILAGADKRGVTITQTSSHPMVYGPLTHLFTLDTEEAIRWDATNATEADPITLEVDLTQDTEIDTYQYMSNFGLLSTWENYPKNIIIEIFDGTGWVEVLNIADLSTNFVISPGFDAYDVVEKIRLKFWGINSGGGQYVHWCKLFAHSTKTPGQTWLPKTGGAINGDAEVQGKLKAKGGLVIPAVTSDPSNPEVGQMWLRTDL